MHLCTIFASSTCDNGLTQYYMEKFEDKTCFVANTTIKSRKKINEFVLLRFLDLRLNTTAHSYL